MNTLINLIIEADVAVQLIMLLLALASMWCWAIAFDKIVRFTVLKKRSDSFEELFQEGSSIEELQKEAQNTKHHPLAKIFLASTNEWRLSSTKKIMSIKDPIERAERIRSLKERLNSVSQVALNRSLSKLENGLNFLAIIGSAAPFVGLFGTVWGIMNSFQGIALSKNTSLATVAPGIAEALLATALGLFAAIPAVFFYNIFTNKINQFADRAENFSVQLHNVFSRELDK